MFTREQSISAVILSPEVVLPDTAISPSTSYVGSGWSPRL